MLMGLEDFTKAIIFIGPMLMASVLSDWIRSIVLSVFELAIFIGIVIILSRVFGIGTSRLPIYVLISALVTLFFMWLFSHITPLSYLLLAAALFAGLHVFGKIQHLIRVLKTYLRLTLEG